MAAIVKKQGKVLRTGKPRGKFVKDIIRDKWLYLLLLPGILFFLIFKYIPMIDLRIAFMDYNPFTPEKSIWVGFDQC